MFGFLSGPAAYVGKPFRTLLSAAGAKKLGEAVEAAGAGGETEATFDALHRNGSVFPLACSFGPSAGLAERKGRVAVRLKALNDSMGLITIDEGGVIVNANSFISSIFGYTVAELTGSNISTLMPRPYSAFHSAYLSAFARSRRSRILGDERGRTVAGRHKNGRVFQMHLEVQEILDADTTARARLFSGRITLAASSDSDRRCVQLRLDHDGQARRTADAHLASPSPVAGGGGTGGPAAAPPRPPRRRCCGCRPTWGWC